MKFVQQLDESDCGAACLAMVANHFKSRLNVAKIRSIAGTDREGTNLAGLVKAAQALGFDARPLRGPAEAISGKLPPPFVAHLKLGEAPRERWHFVVVSRVGKNDLILFDPAEGRRRVSREDFLKQWTGYVVFLLPRADFKPLKEKKGLFSRFLPLLKPHMATLLRVVAASLILIFFGILGALYFRYVIDEVVFARAELSLMVLSIGILVITLFQMLLTAVRNHLLLHFSMKVDFTLIFSYFSHVMRLPAAFFDSHKTGEILSRMDDAARIRTALSGTSVSVMMDSLMVVVVGIFLFLQSQTLFWIAVAALPLSTCLVWAFSKTFAKQYKKLMAESANVHSYLVESIAGNATVRALNAEQNVFQDYEQRQMRVVDMNYKVAVLQNWQGLLVGLLEGWSSNVLFWVGASFILNGQLTLGQLISFTALLGYFLGPLKRLLTLQASLQEAFVAADRLGEILELEQEIPTNGRWIKPEKISGKIVIKNVSFRYGSKRLILENLDCRIAPGERVAFVGPSGCGKTTLAKLLLKFYEPESGEIYLDDHNLSDVDTKHLRSKIGYVPQDIFLFSGSISDNIALNRPEASLEEIVEASRKAQAHGFISELPQRYNTELSERGASLSGGERQRIALARALLGKPELLVFDEATSNLDTMSERSLHETMEKLRVDRITTVLIAHRLTTVVNCDRIFVVNKGTIEEAGNHEQLLASGGAYTRMWGGAIE